MNGFARPSEPGFDVFDQRVKIGKVVRLQLGMEKLPIDPNFEGTTARRHQPERANALLEFQNPDRQTDGLRFVISGGAVFDGDLGLQNRGLLLPSKDFTRSLRGRQRGT